MNCSLPFLSIQHKFYKTVACVLLTTAELLNELPSPLIITFLNSATLEDFRMLEDACFLCLMLVEASGTRSLLEVPVVQFDVNNQLLVSDAYFLSAANILVFSGAGCSQILWPFKQTRVSKPLMIPNTWTHHTGAIKLTRGKKLSLVQIYTVFPFIDKSANISNALTE